MNTKEAAKALASFIAKIPLGTDALIIIASNLVPLILGDLRLFADFQDVPLDKRTGLCYIFGRLIVVDWERQDGIVKSRHGEEKYIGDLPEFDYSDFVEAMRTIEAEAENPMPPDSAKTRKIWHIEVAGAPTAQDLDYLTRLFIDGARVAEDEEVVLATATFKITSKLLELPADLAGVQVVSIDGISESNKGNGLYLV